MPIACVGVRTSPDGLSGSQKDRWRKHGLDRANIVSTVLTALGVLGEHRVSIGYTAGS